MLNGTRKIIIGLIFLIIATVMIFLIKDIQSKTIYYDYMWKLAGIVIAGNGIEHIAKSLKRNK